MSVNQNPAPFVEKPELTAVAVAFQTSGIADAAIPRVEVPTQLFDITTYDIGETFAIPDSSVSRTGPPNKLTFNSTRSTGSVEDRGYDLDIPQDDLDRQGAMAGKYLAALTRLQAQTAMLDREAKASTFLQDTTNYASANVTTFTSSTDKFSDHTNSDPTGAILDLMDAMVQDPTIMWMGRAVWRQLANHPQLVAAFHGNEGAKGIITRQWLADYFGLKAVLVGSAWKTTSVKGQTTTRGRIWGKYLGLAYVDPAAMNGLAPTFAFTAQFGSKVAGTIQRVDLGLKGGQTLRVGEQVKEFSCAPDLGALIVNAVA